MFRTRVRQILRFASYAFILSVIITVIFSSTSSNHSPHNSTTKQVKVSNSDWDFYEDVTVEDTNTDEGIYESDCDPINLAVVCGGSNSTREFYVLLKSILFHRTNPINLYLVVDHTSRKILTKLFETWPVPNLNVIYYDATIYESQISWIPTHHYSNQFGLLKLILPSILSDHNNVSRVIALDTDLLALGNINKIWYKLDELKRNNAAIGLVENQSDWYLGRQKTGIQIQDRLIWPALGRGFNTGMMLMDLEQLKQMNWNQIWRQITEMELIGRSSTALADQDIFNAVIKQHPSLVYRMTCSYNLQLNDHAELALDCQSNLRPDDFRLIHWNSPQKLETSNKLADKYKDWYTTFINWDASLLTSELTNRNCNSKHQSYSTVSERTQVIDKQGEESCKDIRPRPSELLQTYLDFFEHDPPENETKASVVTAVVHLSMDRLRALDELAKHWPGPISAVIYLSELETSLLIEIISSESKHLTRRRNIAYHLVFRKNGFSYPINRLRNIALEQAETEFAFLTDVDFLPSYNLYEYLRSFLTTKMNQFENLDRIALVIAAFENSQYKFEFPENKNQLERQLDLGSVSMFRGQLWPRGQSPTDYNRWRLATQAYRVNWRPDYEPFIVISRQVVRFDERFVGFGWNKVEHIMKLAAQKYQFFVLPEVFIMHQFHPASYDILKHRESHKYRGCIRNLKKLFVSQLIGEHPEFLAELEAAAAAAATFTTKAISTSSSASTTT